MVHLVSLHRSTDGDTHVTMLVNLVESRKDCVAFASPYRSDVVGVTTSSKQEKMLKVL